MSSFELFAAKLFPLEGGFSDDPNDRGGATNRGVTIDTWRQAGYDKDNDGDIDREDIRLLSVEDCMNLLRYNYWDRWRGDEIRNQRVAFIRNIIRNDPAQKRFEKGWMNRVNEFI